jgi:hypothetical protein
MEVSTGQLIAAILASQAALVGALVYILQKFGPKLFDWMRAKIDTKNGAIGELVEQTKILAEDISRMAKAICKQIEQSSKQQEQVLCEMREICARKDEQIDKLCKLIQTAAERAA